MTKFCSSCGHILKEDDMDWDKKEMRLVCGFCGESDIDEVDDDD